MKLEGYMNILEDNPTPQQLHDIISLAPTLKWVTVRAEGEVNQFWKFNMEDPATKTRYVIECHAFEESPLFSQTDERVYSVSESFDDFLAQLFDLLAPYYPDWDEYADAVEFGLYNRNGKLLLEEVIHQKQLQHHPQIF